ncbi:hypothetical protein [Anaerosporobacter sp.]
MGILLRPPVYSCGYRSESDCEREDGEKVQNKEEMPVMSKESKECIEAALGEKTKRFT